MPHKDYQKRLAFNREWRKRNPDKVKEYQLRWEKKNPDYKRSYYAMRRQDKNYLEKEKLYGKEYYQKNKLRIHQKVIKRNQKLRLICLLHYGGTPPKCSCCGENKIEFLTLDHINNDGYKMKKIHGVGNTFTNWLIKNNFPEEFQVLCYNCNCAKGHLGYCPHNIKK